MMTSFKYAELVLAEHVAKTLPDSIKERRKVLHALEIVLKRSHRAYSAIRQQIILLDAMEQLQSELPLKFK